jgi:hypothetical protein
MHYLNLLNNSQAPTFVKGLHKTHIDLTLTSPRLAQLIQTWEVLPDSASPLPHQRHAQATPTNPTDWITPQLVQSTIKSFKSDKDKGESFKKPSRTNLYAFRKSVQPIPRPWIRASNMV